MNSWYQTLPGPRLEVPPVSERLPLRAEVPQPQHVEKNLDEGRRKMIQQRQERLDQFIADKREWYARRAKDSRARAEKNKEYAADVRKRYMDSIKGSK